MNHTCRGTINLAGAFIDTIDSCSFVISNGGSQAYHLRAGSEIERQRWVTALELAKHKAIKMLAADDDSDSEPDDDDLTAKTLGSKLEDLVTCNNLVNNHGATLQRSIGELVEKDSTRSSTDSIESKSAKDDTAAKVKGINEKAQLFRITSNAMINHGGGHAVWTYHINNTEEGVQYMATKTAQEACSDFLELAQAYERKFHKLLQSEKDKRIRLEETVETLAKQHNKLEQACKVVDTGMRTKSSTATNSVESPTLGRSPSLIANEIDEDDEEPDEFFDAISEHPEAFGIESPQIKVSDPYAEIDDSTSTSSDVSSVTATPSVKSAEIDKNENELVDQSSSSILRRSASENILEGSKQELGHRRVVSHDLQGNFSGNFSLVSLPPKAVKQYRTRIPYKPNVSMNLWSIMKNCIGKELSKIPMPVNFNEPLSMTQRLTEELEYSDILDRAAACESSLEQICYIAAFSISCYATTALRTGKPFNPLLGETYELDRTDDMGWRSLAEQVSHHPPSLAHHAEGRGWTLWQNFTMSSKFRGKYLLVTPLGTAHCTFAKSGNHYTWKKVSTTVHNIIVGRLWIDQSGEMDITNHTTGEKCHLKYHAYSYFSKEMPKRVTGYVVDRQKVTRYVLSGFWDQKVECAKVVYREPLVSPGGKTPQGTPTTKHGNPQTLPPSVLWIRKPLPSDAAQMYYFSGFTCHLNEPEPHVSPTDSRLRPDERLMEEGKFDEANQSKQKLEEQQRTRRRKREADAEVARQAGRVYEGYKPTWFEKTKDEYSDIDIFVYKGGYWEAKEKEDWSMCPVIYEKE